MRGLDVAAAGVQCDAQVEQPQLVDADRARPLDPVEQALDLVPASQLEEALARVAAEEGAVAAFEAVLGRFGGRGERERGGFLEPADRSRGCRSR